LLFRREPAIVAIEVWRQPCVGQFFGKERTMATLNPTEQANLRQAQEIWAAINAGAADRLVADFTPDVMIDAPGGGIMNASQYGEWFGAWMRAMPDAHFDVWLLIAQGDNTISNYTISGTHTGPLQMPGAPAIPPTGHKVKVQGSNTVVVKDGKITHLQILFDTGTMMQQLGLMPAAQG
jgi:predicted ester cyclase